MQLFTYPIAKRINLHRETFLHCYFINSIIGKPNVPLPIHPIPTPKFPQQPISYSDTDNQLPTGFTFADSSSSSRSGINERIPRLGDPSHHSAHPRRRLCTTFPGTPYNKFTASLSCRQIHSLPNLFPAITCFSYIYAGETGPCIDVIVYK